VLVYIKLLLTAVFWGGTFIAGRIVVRDVGPYTAALLRFTIATVFLFFFACRTQGRFPQIRARQVVPLMLLGMSGVFFYNLCFFRGLKLIEASRAAIIIANNPICIAVFSALFFKETLSALKICGICLSVLGAMVVISRGDIHHILGAGIGPGELYILGSVASWVAFSLIGKAVLGNLSPLTSVFYASLFGAIALLGPAVSEGLFSCIGHLTFTDWSGLFYLGFFGTVLGFVWYYEGIQKIGPTRAGLFINFVPISAVILAYFILREPMTMSLVAGTVLVTAGVYLTNTGTGKRSPA
jgi:drug/metabolite transporter (DMT)-like permease